MFTNDELQMKNVRILVKLKLEKYDVIVLLSVRYNSKRKKKQAHVYFSLL